MSQSTSVSSGTPSAAPTTTPLARSSSHSRRVMRLKPKRCSMTKVRYHASGNATAPPSSATATTSATSRPSAGIGHASTHAAISATPPPSVSASSIAWSTSVSTIDSRVRAAV